MANKELVQELTQGEFSKVLAKEKDRLVVVDFFAEWCMPCLMMSPIIESAAKKYSRVKFCKINTDDAGELSQKHGISSIPCIIFFKAGKEIARIIGAVSEDELEQKINEIV